MEEKRLSVRSWEWGMNWWTLMALLSTAPVKKLSSSSKVLTGFSKSSSEGMQTQTYTFADLSFGHVYCCSGNFQGWNSEISFGIHMIRNYMWGRNNSLCRFCLGFNMSWKFAALTHRRLLGLKVTSVWASYIATLFRVSAGLKSLNHYPN